MAQAFHIPTGSSREEIYRSLTPQLKALLSGETDATANAANFTALVSTAFRFHWVGFYWVREQELVLGPFQGPIACTRIAKGKGVCGTAWELNETIVVPDVDAFPGHIACSALSRSCPNGFSTMIRVHPPFGELAKPAAPRLLMMSS